MTPETLKAYLDVISQHSLLRFIVDKAITPENIKAAVSGAVEGAIKAKQGE